MSQPNQAKNGKQSVATAPMPESERQALLRENDELKLAIQELQQGKRIDIRQGKDAAIPNTPVNPRKVNKLNAPPTRRTPPRAAVTTRPIPVRRSFVPRLRSAPTQPQVVYKDRVVYKQAPAKPQPTPVAQSGLKPVSRIALTKQYEPPATKPASPPIKIKPQVPAHKPVTVASAPQPQPKPKLTSAESGILVASSQMTGDLLQDISGASEPETQGVTPNQTSLVSGTIPAGTKVKAAFANPLTWVAGQSQEALSGQKVLLRLKEDLGDFAKTGSTAIGEVTSVEGDFAQVQIVEIDGKPIAPVGSEDPQQPRPTPVAVVQYKDTPYLQAKSKNSSGPGLGDKLLRVGLNVGVDQLRDAGIGSRVGSVANSLLPDQQSRFERGSSIYSFEGKDVEIFFLEGI